MTGARPTKSLPHLQPLASGDVAAEAPWPVALRAMLLLAEAVQPTDPFLTRCTDEDLVLLRAALLRLNAIEPTSAA